MNKFRYYFILIITSLALFSCSKDDNNSIEEVPLRDFQEQFTTDSIAIKEYLETYYIDIEDPNFADNDVIIKKITNSTTQPSIMSYLNNSTFPKLLKKNVELHGITYELYYLVLREGTGEKPCNVDEVLTSYKGEYLYRTVAKDAVPASGDTPAQPAVPSELLANQFEELKYPQSFFDLTGVVTGWSEVFPEFKTGDTPVSNADGTVSYSNFGAGVMFLPSGLAYYSSGQGSIPSYSPLVFSFKLYAVKRSDLDNDGIPSYLEDVDGDNYMRRLATGVENPDDSDGDGIPNYLDIDDDGDKFTTRSEITINGVVTPFASIPDCSGNIPTDTSKKKHLDSACH
ncbi:hypothetical protein GCM10008015_24300 [Flavobacterium palustre]|uniref:Peptidylprolyl isomerase n=1 Tax=Flavobacterium palustre TaxID=1476463 RepID=A0ABQ1HN46_9FLAO|nr:FKBP-type peptidylprolyl isomerase [Flavobacterium palustre]GGA82682.1 hypothetical protein GCM10008015_24300 [Flavobacterium palustre]